MVEQDGNERHGGHKAFPGVAWQSLSLLDASLSTILATEERWKSIWPKISRDLPNAASIASELDDQG
jgi:hypothetical protein